MGRENQFAAYGHTRLTEWGARCKSLGQATVSPLGRLMTEIGGRSEGMHTDPTVVAVGKDEKAYECHREVQRLSAEEPEIAKVLILYYVEGFTVREIQGVMSMSVGTVQNRRKDGAATVGARLAGMRGRPYRRPRRRSTPSPSEAGADRSGSLDPA